MRNCRYHIERFFLAPGGFPLNGQSGTGSSEVQQEKAQAVQRTVTARPLLFNIPRHITTLKGILVTVPGKGRLPGGTDFGGKLPGDSKKSEYAITADLTEGNAIKEFENTKAVAKTAEYGRITFSFLSNMRTVLTEWAVSPFFTSFRNDYIPISEQPDNNSLVRVCWKDAGILQDNYELRIYLIYE